MSSGGTGVGYDTPSKGVSLNPFGIINTLSAAVGASIASTSASVVIPASTLAGSLASISEGTPTCHSLGTCQPPVEVEKV